MPDIYMLDGLDESDFITAFVVNQGYPVFMGRIAGELRKFATFGVAAAWMGTQLSGSIIDVMDMLHKDFGPTEAFVDDLRFADKNLFPMDDPTDYIQFNRYDAAGRAFIMIIIALLVKYGLAKQVAGFAGGWLAKMLTDRKHRALVDGIEDLKTALNLSSEEQPTVDTEITVRLSNLEKYLHLLGDSLRTNSRRNNDELEFRSSNAEGSDHLVPEWPKT